MAPKFDLGGGRIVFECPVRFGLFRIGSRSAEIVDTRYERTIINNRGSIIIRGKAWIGAGSRIGVSRGGVLTLGGNLKITGRTSILCKKEITIGRNCLFSWDIQMMDSDFHKIYNKQGENVNANSAINIGNHVWIGSRCMVLKGSVIPDNSIIAAGSVVTGKKYKVNCIYGGIDCRILKDDVLWSDQ